jgi:hypothetical protein
VIVRRDGHRFFVGRRRAAANGKAIFRLRLKKGCFRTSVLHAAAPGYTWRAGTPANRFCR